MTHVPGALYVDAVEQRISLVTFGVRDLARSVRFYEAMGWHGQQADGTAFFQTGGIAVVLWGREELATDAGVDADGSGFSGMAIAHNVRSPGEVDEVIAAAERAGAVVTRAAATTFYGGYAGYFADPDGHLWEIAHNPGFTLTDDGTLILPDFGTA